MHRQLTFLPVEILINRRFHPFHSTGKNHGSDYSVRSSIKRRPVSCILLKIFRRAGPRYGGSISFRSANFSGSFRAEARHKPAGNNEWIYLGNCSAPIASPECKPGTECNVITRPGHGCARHACLLSVSFPWRPLIIVFGSTRSLL